MVDAHRRIRPQSASIRIRSRRCPYSSGTTGLPKGVILTHRILVSNQAQYLDASGIGASDAYPIFLPLSHIYGVMLMNAGLASGAHQI